MFKITSIEKTNKKQGLWHYALVFVCKAGGMLEVLAVLFLWLIIFSHRSLFGDFTRGEMITYILVGNIISVAIGHFLQKVIKHDLIKDDAELLLRKPLRCFLHVLFSGCTKFFLPFMASVAFYLIILYFFIESFVINFAPAYIAIITLMIILAFLTEFLLVCLVNLYIFWTVESNDFYKILVRLRKILAGNYFPLSLLPPLFLKATLALPFAYSFFVPTQLYLKKIDLSAGLRGVGVQIAWIILIYVMIKLVWGRKSKEPATRG